MTPDRQLSPNFSLYQLTRTDHVDLQEENRHVTEEELVRLGLVATDLLEPCRAILGCDLDVHSGRRYLELNKRVGGSPRSEHQKCTAVDFSPKGPDTEESVTDAWQKIITAARRQREPGYAGTGILSFGQLILEGQSKGREGRVWWIHASLGAPYRAPMRCGEVLSMKDGVYTMIARIPC